MTDIRAPVVLGNVARNTAPISLANPVANTTAPIGLANAVTNTAISLSAAADIMDHDILQMGNVVPNEPTIQDLTQQTVFNMRNAVFLTDTVNEILANSFLVQAQDPTSRGRWDSHIQPQALDLIRLRLHDENYRTLCPLEQIPIWPIRLPNLMGEPQQYTLLQIAETIQKLYAPEAAPQTKSIEQRCREVASPSTPIDTPSKTECTVATILKQNEQLSEVDLIVFDEINRLTAI